MRVIAISASAMVWYNLKIIISPDELEIARMTHLAKILQVPLLLVFTHVVIRNFCLLLHNLALLVQWRQAEINLIVDRLIGSNQLAKLKIGSRITLLLLSLRDLPVI